MTNPEARKKKLSAELANGRLAMMAIIGMLLSCTSVAYMIREFAFCEA